MHRCKKSDIKFNGDLKYCPLCQAELEGRKSENVFPVIKKEKKGLLHKVLLFISLSIAILFSFIEYNITQAFSISKFVWLGLITNYILIRFILKNYKNPIKMMNKYFWIILILFFIWFFVIRNLIITTYLIPILCFIIFAFNSITIIVLRDNYIIKFGKTIILDCFIGLIPLLLVFLNLSTFELLSYICAVVDLLIFLGLIIFCRDNILEEFKKIFNF